MSTQNVAIVAMVRVEAIACRNHWIEHTLLRSAITALNVTSIIVGRVGPPVKIPSDLCSPQQFCLRIGRVSTAVSPKPGSLLSLRGTDQTLRRFAGRGGQGEVNLRDFGAGWPSGRGPRA